MLIRGRLSWCSSVPTVALVGVTLIVLTSAAPVTKDKVAAEETVAKAESNRPLVRAKRADEIIFDNEQNVAASSSVGSSPVKKSDQQISPKSDDVTISAGKQQESSPIANNEPEIAQTAAEADESVGNGDSDSSESSDNSASDSADSGSWDSDSDDADKRRRRSASDSVVKAEAAADRAKRAARAAMVSENMAVAGTGNSRLQRAKRDLEADEIREIFEAEQPIVGSVGDAGRGQDYEGSDYGSPRDLAEALDTPTGDGEEEDEDGEYEYADGEGEEFDDETPEMKYVGRPKRRSSLSDEEREEALEEAERQVVRELLAERAAEETRQALINYLTGFEAQQSEPLRIVERGDARFRDEGYEEGFEGDDEESSDEEDGYEEGDEDAEQAGGQEELIEDGDGRFLVGEGADGNELEEQSPSIAEQKRFSYPYSYEPYGGRWGALLPGAKRDDHDPYDRLYQLAEALSRPSSIGGSSSAADDEYKK